MVSAHFTQNQRSPAIASTQFTPTSPQLTKVLWDQATPSRNKYGIIPPSREVKNSTPKSYNASFRLVAALQNQQLMRKVKTIHQRPHSNRDGRDRLYQDHKVLLKIEQPSYLPHLRLGHCPLRMSPRSHSKNTSDDSAHHGYDPLHLNYLFLAYNTSRETHTVIGLSKIFFESTYQLTTPNGDPSFTELFKTQRSPDPDFTPEGHLLLWPQPPDYARPQLLTGPVHFRTRAFKRAFAPIQIVQWYRLSGRGDKAPLLQPLQH